MLPRPAPIKDVLAVGDDGRSTSPTAGNPPPPTSACSGTSSTPDPFFGTVRRPALGERSASAPTASVRPPRHRPAVVDLTGGKVAVTAHDHGFHHRLGRCALASPVRAAYGPVRVSHIYLNDEVVEGLESLTRACVSVQCRPRPRPAHTTRPTFFETVRLGGCAGG